MRDDFMPLASKQRNPWRNVTVTDKDLQNMCNSEVDCEHLQPFAEDGAVDAVAWNSFLEANTALPAVAKWVCV